MPMSSPATIKRELKMMEATDTLLRALCDEQCDSEEMHQIVADISD